uniref:Uncharacterized protein n=1 Tax=Arundo donax TaxID=35708 RepID=A0A0A8ZZX0_ARUDO
MLSSLGELTK